MHTGFAPPETAVAVPPSAPPARVTLAAPFPNPVRDRATIQYGIPSSAAGRRFAIDVYDPAGRHVRRLAQGAAEPGTFTVQWDLRNGDGAPVKSGLYLLVVEAGGERRSRRVVAMP